ncbi:MAG: hypothetical protein ABI216_08845 [Devosia sp.]
MHTLPFNRSFAPLRASGAWFEELASGRASSFSKIAARVMERSFQ